MRFLTSLIIVFSLQLSAQTFTDISISSGVNFSTEQFLNTGSGVCIIDYNNDGWEDFLVPGGYGKTAIFKNYGNLTFKNVLKEIVDSALYAKLTSVYVISAVAGDIDNDGDKDILLTCRAHVFKPSMLLENVNGKFIDISKSAGLTHAAYGVSASMVDFNLDGYLDLYICNNQKSMSFTYDKGGNINSYIPECEGNYFYVNNKNKTFTEKADHYGLNNKGCSLTGCFTDVDNDHDLDLLIANDYGAWSGYPNAVYINQYPKDGFIDQSNITGFNRPMYGMGIAVGDINEDGFLDYFVSNLGANSLYKNNKNTTFTDVATKLGVDMTWCIKDSLHKTQWGANFFDFDNDSYLDLFVASGYVGASFPLTTVLDTNKLFKNNGKGKFIDVTQNSGLASPISNRGAAYTDIDNDGDLDLIVNHSKMPEFYMINARQNIHVFKNNNSNENHWIKIKLNGVVSNKDGYGARVEAFIKKRKLIREIDGGSSHASINSSIVHFGLGKFSKIDSLVVYWPGGKKQVFSQLNTNQTILITENEPQYRMLASGMNEKKDTLAFQFNNIKSPYESMPVLKNKIDAQKNEDVNNIVNNSIEHSSDFLLKWIQLHLEMIKYTNGYTPPVASRTIGYTYMALYESVVKEMKNNISVYEKLNGSALPVARENKEYFAPASASASVAYILKRLFPFASSKYIESMNVMEKSDSLEFSKVASQDVLLRSIAYGRAVAEQIFEWSLNDGGGDNAFLRNYPTTYEPPVGPGLWKTTPSPVQPAFHLKMAMQPYWGNNRPFQVANVTGKALLSPPPPFSTDTSSVMFKEAMDVYKQSKVNTQEQKDIAIFWSDDVGSYSPPGHSLAITSIVLKEKNVSLAVASEVLTKIGMGVTDAFINCFKNKYIYNLLRPVTYIQEHIDKNWNTLIGTPPFPEYVSCHSTQSAASARILTHYFGDDFAFTDNSKNDVGYTPRKFKNFYEFAQEAAISRYYGGVHYMMSCNIGYDAGLVVGDNILNFSLKKDGK
jgi:hypothetical protein